MSYKKMMILLGIVFTMTVGCQSEDLFDEPADYIEVEDWDSNDQDEVGRIEQGAIIEELTEDLNSANQASVADLDIPHPDYALTFYSEEDTLMGELGYYTEEMNFHGTTGQYIDFDEGIHYGSTFELPLEDH